jgi:hypothetical protein
MVSHWNVEIQPDFRTMNHFDFLWNQRVAWKIDIAPNLTMADTARTIEIPVRRHVQYPQHKFR